MKRADANETGSVGQGLDRALVDQARPREYDNKAEAE